MWKEITLIWVGELSREPYLEDMLSKIRLVQLHEPVGG